MFDGRPDGCEAEVSRGKPRRIQYGVLAAACSLVIGVYVYTASTSHLVSTSLDAADAYYNLLVQGFRAGQLNLKKEVPLGLAQLANPYDRTANTRYRVLDLSYYKGRLYLYFGVTPAVLLFWPYVALTGRYLLQKDAAVVFCLVGFLTSAGLLYALWRRYFAEVNVGVAAGTVALGLATFAPFLLGRCDVYEVSISCGYALTMVALAAIWKALHEPRRRGRWLAVASLAYGLAVGARPSLLPGVVVLLAPVIQARRETRKVWPSLMAATIPLVLIGLGLMLYNALRFDNPFEFGWHYQMSGGRQDTVQPFGLQYLWFNFRVFFLEPARWTGRFPFVHDIQAPPSPVGYGGAEHPFGVLTNVPLVWLVLVVPLAWRGRSPEARFTLCGFLAALVLLFGICALTLCLHRGANTRYEMEFVPALVLLAVIGVLGLERALVCQPVWRCVARCGWGLLLGFSVVFNLLASIERCAEAHYDRGNALLQVGQTSAAVAHYEQALCLKPDFVEAHNNLGLALRNQGKISEAIGQYEDALGIKPDSAEVLYNLGIVLSQTGRIEEAIGYYEHAVRLKPDYAEAQYNLGNALREAGRTREAIAHWEQAVRIDPDLVEAQNNLGVALARLGQVPEAIGHYERALQIKPDLVEAQNNLGVALARLGQVPEAIGHYEWALQIKPDYAEAHYNLGVALAGLGKVPEAIGHWEQAVRLNPDYAEAHNNLGGALLRLGRVPEAIEHFEEAVRIAPGMVEARCNLGIALEQAGNLPEAIRQYEQVLRLKPDSAEAQNRLARLRAIQ